MHLLRSPVVKEKNNQFYCTFCSMFIRNVQEDGNRIQVSFNEDPSEDDLKNNSRNHGNVNR